MKRFLGWWWLLGAGLLVLAISSASAQAQGPDDCAQTVLLAMARASAACQSLDRDQACFGSGSAQAAFFSGTEPSAFDAPGDIVTVRGVQQLSVDSDTVSAQWSVATLHIRADLVEEQQRSVVLLLFGDVTLENAVPLTPEVVLESTGTLYIRVAPTIDADIITQLGLRETVIANGRTEDARWLRIIVPGTNQLGWVARDVVASDANLNTLAVGDEHTPFFRPFQVFTLRTEHNDAWCSTTPESGLLIQTPNTFTDVTLMINGVTFRIAATAFLQAQADGMLTVNVLGGQVEVETNGASQFIPAGGRTQIALDSEALATANAAPATPYDQDDVQALPVNNLPYRFQLLEPLTQAEIDTLVSNHAAAVTAANTEDTDGDEARCEHRVWQDTSLWAGPGQFYEVVNAVAAGTRVYPVWQTTAADGAIWWQLTNNNWIRADAITSASVCDPVPVAEYVAPPATNYLSLETCMTTNGPLRNGQRVTLDFVPPAFTTSQEALDAPSVDPGRITVGSQRLWVTPSRPVKIADERYVVTFRAQWIAEPGTFRIVGQRLSYIVICDITVPLGQ